MALQAEVAGEVAGEVEDYSNQHSDHMAPRRPHRWGSPNDIGHEVFQPSLCRFQPGQPIRVAAVR